MSREVRQWTARELTDVYSLHAAFGGFFHVARFRHVQALTGAVITGSRALAFLGLYGWAQDSDLDIVVSVSGAARLASFLLSEGYAFDGESLQASIARVETMHVGDGYGSSRSVLAVLKFRRTSCLVVTHVDMVVAVSPLGCILSFHSSA